jgi:hypothetical protein
MPSSYINASNGFPSDYVPITPHDTVANVDQTRCMGFRATVAGNIVFVTAGGTRTVAVAVNENFIVRGVSLLKSTGTTATGIFAIYL